ncbi:MAG: L-threonylcarbamoyladenylate synthase [Candidatus Marinimicrobia bacterium]|jgi:L-threonylcarbamoyladenylate synthase|nr:L-threonylcarbamoyladenylate synthase [Candidatus Neomarinimicrobiota bacterium]
MSLRISSQSPEAMSSAIKIIKSGGIIVYPTDTLYGFGGDASNSNVIEKINKIKNRKGPMSVLVSDMNMAFKISELSGEEENILSQKLGGANTIIVPAKRRALCSEIFGTDCSVGIRIPNHPFGKNLVQTLNYPITTTSVNRTGKIPLNDANEIMKQFGNQIDLLVDEGQLPDSKGSRIYKLMDKTLKIIR